MSKKKWIGIGAGMLVATVLGTGVFYIGQPSTPHSTVIEQQTARLVTSVISHNANGKIALYDVKSGKQLDTLALRSLLPDKEVVIEEKQKVPTPVFTQPKAQTEPQQVKTNENNLFKGYEKAKVTIKKGETVWGIQAKMIPNENVLHLLPLLQEVNEGKNLNTIHPKEVFVFLQKPSSASVPPETPVKETPLATTPVEKIIKKTIKAREQAEFIYFKDVEHKALYAYSDASQTAYRITNNEGKLKVEPVQQNPVAGKIISFVVENKNIWLLDSSKQHVVVVSEKGKVFEFDTKGEVSEWIVKENSIFYTHGNRLASHSLSSNSEKDVEMGDKSLDMVRVKDKLFVLNSFGTKSGNSLLYKVNPADLKVEDLFELKTDESAILSHGNENVLYLGKMDKYKDLNGNVEKEPKVVSMNLSTLKADEMKWSLLYSPSMMSWSHYLYALENGNLNMYLEGKETPSKTIVMDADGFTLLP